MAMEMTGQGGEGTNNIPNDDVPITSNGTGPGTITFDWNNSGVTLFQAFTASLGRASDTSLLPKNFVLKRYRPRSCDIVRNKCLRQGQNYEDDLCEHKWRLLLDTGESGSKYFLSANEDFIIKTIQDSEHNCLNDILPRLCHFLTDNPQTLLPRFFGLYRYTGGGKKIRFMVMNNLLPNHLQIDKRFDLKGATKRKTATNVGKDDEFLKTHPNGFEMDERYVTRLRELLELDCMHLRELGLTNYSLFIAVHEVDKDDEDEDDHIRVSNENLDEHSRSSQTLGLLGYRSRGVPARLCATSKVLLYIGIIHILKPYTLRNKEEYLFKSMLPGGDDTPVQPPKEFEERFMRFVRDIWFKPQ
ncbi:unnamed protein product [Lymnaea stagnalis]|uniref:PIPK domain-containing protein n=1 Tax=Lymnaea stagnalis TaxID=6523 RepID=A0AAV2H3A4_LYMST